MTMTSLMAGGVAHQFAYNGPMAVSMKGILCLLPDLIVVSVKGIFCNSAAVIAVCMMGILCL